VEKTLNENRHHLDTTTVARIETAIESVRQAIKGEDAALIKRTTSELERASHALAEELYKRGQAASASEASSRDGNKVKDGEVIDAEVVGAGK
jgi:molecular chaperone DnaK